MWRGEKLNDRENNNKTNDMAYQVGQDQARRIEGN